MAEFSIDQDKINELVKRVYMTYLHETDKFRRFMPQHNLPEEFEFSPKRKETREPLKAAQFLLTEAFFERRTQSRQIIKACLDAWNNPDERWIFNPKETVRAGVYPIDAVMEKLPYTAHHGNSLKVSEHYFKNAVTLSDLFDGDPRNIIKGKTTEEAREALDSLWGIGNGIANLYITYLMERDIAYPLDPRNALLKVDVHKARIPLNIEAVVTGENRIKRYEIESALEQAYWKASEAYQFPPEQLDGALWVIGSEICARKSYHFCQHNCPAADLCKGYAPEDKKTGYFLLRSEKGERIDIRKGRQLALFPRHEEPEIKRLITNP